MPGEICSVVTTGLLVVINSVESVPDEEDLAVDAGDTESMMVDSNVVEGSFGDTFVTEPVDVINGDWFVEDDVCLKDVVCIIIACSPVHAESLLLILK